MSRPRALLARVFCRQPVDPPTTFQRCLAVHIHHARARGALSE